MPGTAALPQNSAVAMYLALALLIIFARGLGELAIKLKQPAIVGEVSFAENFLDYRRTNVEQHRLLRVLFLVKPYLQEFGQRLLLLFSALDWRKRRYRPFQMWHRPCLCLWLD